MRAAETLLRAGLPFDYLTLQVVPRLWSAPLRHQGIHHATLEWFAEPDYAWETSKAATGTAVAKAPTLPRPTPETGRVRGRWPAPAR